jgi:Domain of unknown function (DUF4124)
MRALAVLLLIMFSGWAHAQAVYKWVDRDGITHYSSKPPAKGVKYSTISVAPPPRRAAAPIASAPVSATATGGPSSTTIASPPPRPALPQTGPRSASCAEAKSKLDVMEAAPSMTTTDAISGSAREMNFQERRQAIIDQVQVVTRACRR